MVNGLDEKVGELQGDKPKLKVTGEEISKIEGQVEDIKSWEFLRNDSIMYYEDEDYMEFISNMYYTNDEDGYEYYEDLEYYTYRVKYNRNQVIILLGELLSHLLDGNIDLEVSRSKVIIKDGYKNTSLGEVERDELLYRLEIMKYANELQNLLIKSTNEDLEEEALEKTLNYASEELKKLVELVGEDNLKI